MRILSSLIITSLFLLTGCIGNETKPTQYYVIDPGTYVVAPLTEKSDIKIEILDLQLPQYLERFHIATREEINRLKFSDTHQWAENLRKNLIRTMSRNLSTLLNTIDISTPLGRSASVMDYRIQIYIEQFEQNVDNSISLIARWQISTHSDNQPLGVYATELDGGTALVEDDYDAMVGEMSLKYAELSKRIAESLLEHLE